MLPSPLSPQTHQVETTPGKYEEAASQAAEGRRLGRQKRYLEIEIRLGSEGAPGVRATGYPLSFAARQ